MSKYTAQLKSICESVSGLSAPDNNYNSVISSAAPRIFDFDFPIFDEEYRNVLERKILKHFYLYEIGCETYGMWKMMLDERMNIIMPYYNELYKAHKGMLEKNIYNDVDMTETKESTGRSTGNTKNNEIFAETGTSSKNSYDTSTDTGESTISQNMKGEESGTVNEDTSTTKTSTNTYEKGNTGTDIKTTQNTEQNDGSDGKIITNTNKGKNTSTATNESVSDGTKWNYMSDTPQGGIENVQILNYLTSLEKATDKTEITESSSSTINSENSTNVEETTTYGRVVRNNGADSRTLNLKEKMTENGSENVSDTKSVENTKNTSETNSSSGNEKRHNETISEETGNSGRNSSSNKNTDTTLNTTEEYVLKVVGKRGGELWSVMFKSFKDNLLNIDRMVIDDLTDLFMLLW